MKKYGPALVAFVIVFGLISLAYFAHRADETRNQAWYDYYGKCEFKGSRIRNGFGGGTVYIYDCNGITEETFYQPRR